MKWEYRLTTNTIWASFDYGEVEADSQDEALRLAEKELTAKLELVNSVLSTSSIKEVISMDMDQIEINPKVVQTVAKLVYVNFVTRVLVSEDATESEILDAAKPNLLDKLNNELHENLEEIIDDIECPVQLEELLP